MIKRQYTLYLENKPGSLAEVSKLLAREKINIEGISVAESTDTALVQIIVSNSARTQKALKKAGIAFTSQKVSVLVLRHEPGSLSGLAADLAKAKVNISYIYATAADDQSTCCVVIGSEFLDEVEQVAARRTSPRRKA